ncbi:MAG: K+/H+ antiporter subunit F [bacterium]|jgi:multicomponent K+:H+ antiporter subunit F|nr:K+/H+ antiporter subunit F [Betaproteobacteria bacterium]
MLDFAILTGIAAICLSMLLVLVRVLRGPTLPDRIVALDALYVNAIALIILLGISEADQIHFEAAILIALLGFAGTVALAKFALRRDVME